MWELLCELSSAFWLRNLNLYHVVSACRVLDVWYACIEGTGVDDIDVDTPLSVESTNYRRPAEGEEKGAQETSDTDWL